MMAIPLRNMAVLCLVRLRVDVVWGLSHKFPALAQRGPMSACGIQAVYFWLARLCCARSRPGRHTLSVD
ncbi:hypothetical protein DPW25_15425, partial [Enterococcus faecium]